MKKISNEAEAINKMVGDWFKLIVAVLAIFVGFVLAVAWVIWRFL